MATPWQQHLLEGQCFLGYHNTCVVVPHCLTTLRLGNHHHNRSGTNSILPEGNPGLFMTSQLSTLQYQGTTNGLSTLVNHLHTLAISQKCNHT